MLLLKTEGRFRTKKQSSQFSLNSLIYINTFNFSRIRNWHVTCLIDYRNERKFFETVVCTAGGRKLLNDATKVRYF